MLILAIHQTPRVTQEKYEEVVRRLTGKTHGFQRLCQAVRFGGFASSLGCARGWDCRADGPVPDLRAMQIGASRPAVLCALRARGVETDHIENPRRGGGSRRIDLSGPGALGACVLILEQLGAGGDAVAERRPLLARDMLLAHPRTSAPR